MLSGLASILNQFTNVALLASWFAPSLFDFMNLGVKNPLSNSPYLPANHQLSPKNRPIHRVTLAARPSRRMPRANKQEETNGLGGVGVAAADWSVVHGLVRFAVAQGAPVLSVVAPAVALAAQAGQDA